MSNSNSFGGKLKKVLASMCSLFVGASGVSQAGKTGTSMPAELKFDKNGNLFGFGDSGWILASKVGNVKRENSWLVDGWGTTRYQSLGKENGIEFDAGFALIKNDLCNFQIWADGKIAVYVSIPKGILFDVMRYFECKYFPDNSVEKNNGTKLSCTKGNLNPGDEVFLRFILWAFCGSNLAIDPKCVSSADELKKDIFEFAVDAKFPQIAAAMGSFESRSVKVKEDEKEVDKEYAVLRPGYFLGNFYNRVCDEVYKDLVCDVTDMDDMVNLIAKLNNEKKNLKNQKHIGKYLLGTLIGLVGGGALVEGAHRFLGAKRSESSEVDKGKTSSNKKGGQKAKKNLKKRRG